MKSKLNRFTQTAAASLILGCTAFAAHAEITLIKQDPKPDDLLSRLNFQVGGSIRPQWNMETGGKDKGSYKNNGFDGGSRFRFSSDYYLFDDISWINYYELGVNFPALFDWNDHYANNARNTTRRMLYTGFKSKTYGQLTFGQQNSVYYDVVGAKTDIWDYDMRAQAPSNGVNGDYDGSYRSRKQLKYKNSFGNTDIYASYLFADNDLLTGDGLRYKRKDGGSVGVDYHITKELTWGTAYNYTDAEMKNPSRHSSTDYDHNFLTTKLKTDNDYFAGDAYGLEYFLGYTIPVNQFAVKTVQPYFMGDRLSYVTGRNYQIIDNGLGISLQMNYGFRVDYEHVFTSTTDDRGDMNLIRLRYDF